MPEPVHFFRSTRPRARVAHGRPAVGARERTPLDGGRRARGVAWSEGPNGH